MVDIVIGGCRSGKSAHALGLAESYGTLHKLFIATCRPLDDEMRARIARHRRERSPDWNVLEVPLDLPEALRTHAREDRVLLVDCLTLWLTNLIMERDQDDFLAGRIEALIACLDHAAGPIVFVANEVGQGIVPENRLARKFRDWAGTLNQRVAQKAVRVVWVVAGIPVTIKP
jgi:adenosylcobinamide kinase/adenosylcobinamide-phosphate guanylyltransferase